MSSQPFRASRGGRIDRTREIAFTFDGRAYTGHPGDTLASALLANGVRLVGRSFKYHRPRGIYSAGVEEPNALVQLRSGARSEPNIRATQVELFDGLVAQSQNRWPSLAFDAGAVAGWFSRLFPAGFYYKTFMGPGMVSGPRAWLFYERFIRRAAGFGKAPTEPDPDTYAKRYAHCDVLVVGAGPAGVAAALAAARSGARVVLADENARLGGALRAEEARIGDEPAIDWVERTGADLAQRDRVRVLRRTTAFGYFDHNLVALCERAHDHVAVPPAHAPRQRVWWVRAHQVVLASGAIERPLVFENNDLPGVMLASAVRRYAREQAVLCGRRALVFTNNDSAYATIDALHALGAQVRAVVDVRAGGPGADAAERARAAGVECLPGHVVARAQGGSAVETAEVWRYDAERNEFHGEGRPIGCDLLCVSAGWNPTVHLFSQAQGRLRYDPDRTAFVPAGQRAGLHPAGAVCGHYTLGEALAAGAAAGTAAASAAGLRAPALDLPQVPGDAEEGTLQALWQVPCAPRRRGKRFVDLQNDVTADDVRLAVREGFSAVEHLKRYTTLGMGTDQGRTSNVNGLAILAGLRSESIPDVGTTTFRPPFSPVTLGAVAGSEVGANLAPVRRTPMHEWHREAGAPFVTAGPWLRAQYYPRSGEDMMQSIWREAKHVRTHCGIVDVSPLGKIELQGRDVATFLERVYVNRWQKLAVGRCRYGLMLREDGVVFDDGTTTRIGEREFYMTTTTAKAGEVLAHLEFYAQTVWPELHVHLASVTDQWAGLALAGPESRAVLAAAVGASADVSDAGLPFMGYRAARIADCPVRLFRITFSGELAYEIHTPSDYGQRVWEAVLEAGKAHAIIPYGTEAMSILRIEKGHVVGGELDGRTYPDELGFGRMLKTEGDFIGRRSLDRPALAAGPRRGLVGLVSANGKRIPRGAQLVADPAAPRPAPMLGHVTSTCFSPNLEKAIALGVLADHERWLEQRLYASSPLVDEHVPVTVTRPVFFDPEGERPRG